MKGRAKTSSEKRVVMERILAVWVAVPNLRLGQLLENACDTSPLYYMEDEPLAQAVEEKGEA
ncbi:hypothetical protein LCGC14_0478570 [marine sediment metagenome]|uniref:Uncharacterized protein n=1 Tax=marine sediment metagenome TaxID=412755 RepID=A0A0F9VIQ2_9ZZZZ